MELRTYLGIFERRWLAIVALPLVVLIAVIVLDSGRTPNYTADARVSINRISPNTTVDKYEFDDYYDLLASDFIVDDLVEIVRGNVFATAVADRLAGQGFDFSSESVAAALTASREHRILTIRSTSNDHGRAVILANAASAELREDYQDYIGQEGEPLPVTMRAVEVPTSADSDSLRVRLVYAIAVVVAAGFGVLLALGLEYLDDSLNAESARSLLGLQVLGTVREIRR